jgi:tRNA(Phe) wybutosine-synthesizing methylase Tyw3
MITDFKKLSDALSSVASSSVSAPRGAQVVEAIRDQKERIDSEIREHGKAYVTVEGWKFLVRPAQE